MNSLLIQTIKTVTKRYPAVIPHLNGQARWVARMEKPLYPMQIDHIIGRPDYMIQGEIKTFEFFRRQVAGLIRGLYNGDVVRSEFLDIMANVIQGQLTQAYHAGMQDAGLMPEEITSRMSQQLETFIVNEYPFVDRLANEILNARALGNPVEPLTQRAQLWANRWNEVFNAAKIAVSEEFGMKMIWLVGATEHCVTCITLNGKVAFASEWQQAGLRPQSQDLACSGYNCQCQLIPTEKRRSPNVLSFLMSVPRS